MRNNKIVLIQGALDEEINIFLLYLQNLKKQIIANYEFYEGTIEDIKVILSKTEVGVINSTITTTLGILNYHPNIVINQGIAGSHSKNLHIGDIVVGEACVNINAYKMPVKNIGEGSNPFEWMLNKRAKEIYESDKDLVEKIYSFLSQNRNNVSKGIIGSGDVFNREYDRIVWIQDTFKNLCEDMESIGAYSACNKLKVPCIGIRIISNNELLREEIDKSVASKLQELLLPIIKRL